MVTSASPWRWTFHNEDQLRGALEEYGEFYLGIQGARLGMTPGGGGEDGKKRWRVMRQNAEIDRRMMVLEVWAPKVHKLLDLYYRRGLCAEADGWAIAAARCGLGCDRDSAFDREIFDAHCAWCIGLLLHTDLDRRERTLDTGGGR